MTQHNTYLEMDDIQDDPRDPIDVERMQADAMRDILGRDLYRALESRAARIPEPDHLLGQLAAYRYLMDRYDSYPKIHVSWSFVYMMVLISVSSLMLYLLWRTL